MARGEGFKAPMTRRTVLAALGASLLASCTPARSANGDGVVGECLSVNGFGFDSTNPCGQPDAAPRDDADIALLECFGSLYVSDSTLTCFFKNALCEWDLESGDVVSIRARRLDSLCLYANSGSASVVGDCAGQLVVYEDGCATRVMNQRDGSRGYSLVGVYPSEAGYVLSLDSHGALVKWDVSSGERTDQRDIDGFRGQWAGNLSHDYRTLVMSSLRGTKALVIDAETLQVIAEFSRLPKTASGWVPMPDGRLIAGGVKDSAVLVFDGENIEQVGATRTPCETLSVASDGRIFLGASKNPDSSEDPTLQMVMTSGVASFAHDIDGRHYALRQEEGPVEIDPSDGHKIRSFQYPPRA